MIEIFYSNTRAPELEKRDQPKAGSWIHAVEPTSAELQELSEAYDLDLDLLFDATDIYESPRVEREDNSVYIFTRYCYPDGKDIATEPLLIIYNKDYLFTIMRRSSTVLDQMLNGVQPVLTTQRTKSLLQFLGSINTSYVRNIHQISKQILSIRSKLSKQDIKNEYFIEFIDLEEILNEYLSSLQSQAVVFRNLLSGKFLPLYEQDEDLIEDLSLGTTELIDIIKSRQKTISNTREAYATIMANNLNKTFKKLTSIGIFLTIPTITTGLYGMNLRLPLSRNPNAFWLILLIVMSITSLAILMFKKLKLL